MTRLARLKDQMVTRDLRDEKFLESRIGWKAPHSGIDELLAGCQRLAWLKRASPPIDTPVSGILHYCPVVLFLSLKWDLRNSAMGLAIFRR